MRKALYLVGILFMGLLFTSCSKTVNDVNTSNTSNTGSTVNTTEQKVVKVGVLAPLSGGAGPYGEDAVNVYNIISEEVNEELKEKNTKLELIIEDTKCNGKDSVLGYNKLINVDKVDVVVGAMCSAATVPAAKITQNKKIPMISPISSAPAISDIGDYIYRFYNDLDASKKVNEYMMESGAKSIAILVENTDYGVGYGDALKSGFDGEIVFYDKFDSNEKDFSIIAKKVAENMDKIDFLVFVPNNENTTIGTFKALEKEEILKDLISKGKIIGSEVTTTDGVIKQMGDSLEGLISTMLVDDISILGDKAVSFMDNYKSKHEVKSSELFVLLDAEALNIVANAVKQGNLTSEDIQSYVQKINETNKATGYIGEYYFDPKGDAVGLDFLIGKVSDGKLVNAE